MSKLKISDFEKLYDSLHPKVDDDCREFNACEMEALSISIKGIGQFRYEWDIKSDVFDELKEEYLERFDPDGKEGLKKCIDECEYLMFVFGNDDSVIYVVNRMKEGEVKESLKKEMDQIEGIVEAVKNIE